MGKQSKQKTGGCLLWILKIICACMIIPFVLVFGWIAGIIWYAFFRRKLNDNPQKQKKWTMAIVGGSIFSFICCSFGLLSPKATPPASLSLIYNEGSTLDINTDYKISVEYAPSDASLTSVTYEIDNPLIASVESDADSSEITLHTIEEGTVNIIAKTSDVESNTLTFNVVDSAKIAEEEARKEAEEQARLEEQAKQEAEEQNRLEEQVTQEAEDQEESDEPGQKEIEEQAKANSQTAEKNTPKTDSEPISEPVASETTAPEVPVTEVPAAPAPETAAPVGAQVWLSATGSKYHSINNCGKMNPNKARLVTLEEAINLGMEKCDKCY